MLVKNEEVTIIQLQPCLAAQAVAVGRKHHVRFEVLPRIGVLERPTEFNRWLGVPRDQDTSFIPRWADRRPDWLREAGITVMQEIVMHELKPEQIEVEAGTTLSTSKMLGLVAIGVAGLAVVATAAVVVSAISAVTATAAATATAAVTTPTAIAAGAGLLALGLDPALICVLDDGMILEDGTVLKETWLCVAEWHEV